MKNLSIAVLVILSCFQLTCHARQLNLDNPNIRYHGRVTAEKEFAWTGSGFSLNLSSGSIAATINTPQGSVGAVTVVVNNRATSLILKPGRHRYLLAEKLTLMSNAVTLFKRNEASGGKLQLLSLEIDDSAQLLPVQMPEKKLLAIGDSITCGYGNEALRRDEGNTLANQNGYQSYTAITARALDAELEIVCWSGRGIYRNRMLKNDQQGLLPELFNFALPRERTGTLPLAPSPNWILINLGTNDLANARQKGELSKADYLNAYRNFVVQLRTQHPRAALIFAIGPMATTPINQWLSELAMEVKHASTLTFKKFSGDKEIGGHYHPSVYKHQLMAEQLVDHIRQLENR